MPAGNLDWLYHLLGGTLAAAGLLLLLWSLFWDRSRGRRRCPKCWYDLSGVPGLTCPECGCERRHERAFRRTRRRWRLAIVGLVALVGARWVAHIPDVRARGWWAAAPRPVLIAALPWLDSAGPVDLVNRSTNPLFREILLRFPDASVGASELLPWERWLARRIARGIFAGSASDQAKNLAAMFFVSAGGADPASLPEDVRARVIVALATRVYTTCATCRITGVVNDNPFFIAFERDTGNFRFEYSSSGPRRERYVIWRNAGVLHKWYSFAPNSPAPTDLLGALADAAVVSSGASRTVPQVLLRYVDAVGITDVLKARIGGPSVVQGHECFVINGVWWRGGDRTLVIDKQSYVIRYAKDRTYHSESHREIVVDGPVDPAWFEFDPAYPDRSPLP